MKRLCTSASLPEVATALPSVCNPRGRSLLLLYMSTQVHLGKCGGPSHSIDHRTPQSGMARSPKVCPLRSSLTSSKPRRSTVCHGDKNRRTPRGGYRVTVLIAGTWLVACSRGKICAKWTKSYNLIAIRWFCLWERNSLEERT